MFDWVTEACLSDSWLAKDEDVNSSRGTDANTAQPQIEMSFISSTREFSLLWKVLIFLICPLIHSEEITLNKVILQWWPTDRGTVTRPTPPSSLQSQVMTGIWRPTLFIHKTEKWMGGGVCLWKKINEVDSGVLAWLALWEVNGWKWWSSALLMA